MARCHRQNEHGLGTTALPLGMLPSFGGYLRAAAAGAQRR